MPLTLLLDLDDTLLTNDVDTFVPVYLEALTKYLSAKVHPARLATHLLAATRKMIATGDPACTLEEVFDEHFYPALGESKQALAGSIQGFYEEIFPTLAHLTAPRPEAVRLVDTAFERGWRVVVATNPLFPRRAIEHRLAWAGLPVERYPFELVTSYEHMHFAKPNPAYYAEILGRLGWPGDPVAVVGNSLVDDLAPAAALGIPGFWLDGGSGALPDDMAQRNSHGELHQVLPWLEQAVLDHPIPALDSPSAMLAVLISTPAVFDWFLRVSAPECWGRTPVHGEWCFTEIICHLRDSDREINLPRLEYIVQNALPFIAAVNADEWSAVRGYCDEDGRQALAGFIQTRLELVRGLSSLLPTEWLRPARHAIFGPTTLQELVGFITTHDRTHIQQAGQTLARVAAGLA